jgi:phosphohistidine phosphatase
MILGFLRHAEAEDGQGSDFHRSLTPKGLEQAARVGKFCLRNGLRPDVILTSPVVRARQTAEIVAAAVGREMVEAAWLACGMETADLVRGLAALPRKDFVLLVGHEPDFSTTIAELLGLPDPSALNIRKATLAVLELAEATCGQLQFLVPARLMS